MDPQLFAQTDVDTQQHLSADTIDDAKFDNFWSLAQTGSQSEKEASYAAFGDYLAQIGVQDVDTVFA